ncbi:hypothetical protein [Tenacibaculum xiamenense]|uniref:hypothetical protein n=1 Tax=Tenacibaculum xiamenense TaxID=1261553 RepID=UPI003894C47B
MIKIDDISKEFKFPVIDFKLQNSGNATAFLWQFIIDVKKIELDITPSLSLEYKVVPTDKRDSFFHESLLGNLEIIATNNGYGAALNCNIEISHPKLEDFFSKSERTFIGQIDSGESKSILTLPGDKLSAISNEYCINEISAFISCYDLLSKSYKDKSYVRSDYGHWNKLRVTKKGFLFEYGFYQKSALIPSEIYCVILDPEKNVQQRTYKISREIKAGDIDRFHIMIGCSKSAQIELNFQFTVDKDNIIKSNDFQINIWNPLNSKTYDRYYTDGDVLKYEFEKMNQKKDKQDDFELSQLKWKIESLNNNSTFPFYDKNKEDDVDWW